MSIDTSGSGLTSPHLPPTQTYEQWVTSAQAENQQIALNVRPEMDSADVSIADWNPVERHRTDPSRPNLKPIQQLRVSEGMGQAKEADSSGVMQELLNALPKEVLARLLHSRTLAPEERDLAYVALDHMLEEIAGPIVWLELMNDVALNPLIAQRGIENKTLPYFAAASLYEMQQFVLGAFESHLHLVGPNDPHHDILLGLFNELGNISSDLKALYDEISNGEMSAIGGEKLKELADSIHLLKEQMDSKDLGPNGQILGAVLSAMDLVVGTLALNVGPKALVMALISATKDLDLGPELTPTIKSFASGLSQLGWGQLSELERMKALHAQIKEIPGGA